MKKQGFPFLLILHFLIFTFASPTLFAQEWTEPMNISNLGGYSVDPDIVIDHSDVMHVVWSYCIEDWYWKIMYTRSDDDGETWTEPLDLLQNTDLWMSQPHIDYDSKNNLYVTYDYATGTPDKMVYMIVYDGFLWSEPILISEGMPGSDYNKVLVDNDDKIFVFWHLNSYYTYYRILDGILWSEFYCPFGDSTDRYLVSGHAKDIGNNNFIKWSGVSASFNYFGERAQYYELNTSDNRWKYPEMINDDTINVYVDIALNDKNLPECVYRNKPLGGDKTKHTQKEGNSWSDPEVVAGVNESQQYQQIAVDQNGDLHIVEVQMPDDGLKLVHYQKYGNKWIGQFIDTCYIVLFPDLIFNDNILYVVYNKTWPVAPQTFESDLFLCKYEIVTNIKEEIHQQPGLKIFPNPAKGSISIEFENNNEQEIELSVYDITGRHIITLINKNIPPGVQQILWNGKDKNGKEVKSGSYLVRLSYGRDFVSQTVEIVR